MYGKWCLTVLLIATLGAAVARGAEAPDANQTDTESAQATASNPDAESPEIFVPTEEISEDFAVPFPVDI